MRAAQSVLCIAIAALGLAWPRPVQAATIPDAAFPSLIVGSNGLGTFAYYDRVNGDLMVGRCLDTTCTTVTTSVLDSTGDVGRFPSITPGSATSLGPVISYEDTTNRRLKLALCAALEPATGLSFDSPLEYRPR